MYVMIGAEQLKYLGEQEYFNCSLLVCILSELKSILKVENQ